ncbi:MAG: hypothetical protein K8T20_18415 [Planctomycetes bacterium]|nr:hypothetical protein [Planctomycetota bacterium]
MGQDRTVVVAAATTLGLAAAALGLVFALRDQPPPATPSVAVVELSSPEPAPRPAPPVQPEKPVVNPLRPDPPISPRLQAEQDRAYAASTAAADTALAEGRFRDADFEIRALLESRPEKQAELDKKLSEIARLAQAAFEEVLASARRDPDNARTALASMAARAPEEIARKANAALQEIDDARGREDAGKKVADAEKLAAGGKLKDAAELLDAVAAALPENESRGVKDRAALWRRLANYVGAMDPAELLAVDAATLDAVEPAVEEFLATGDADKRNAIVQKLQALPAATPDVVAAVLLRGGSFEAISPGDHVEKFALPGGETRDIVISVPQGYTPDHPWPVFLNLHGTNATLDFCQGYAPYFRRVAKGRYIVAQPVAERSSGWGPMKIGEQQAPAALQFLRSKFPIDPDRVWLAGQSMGAHGTWQQAMRHGDLYACYIPRSGPPYKAAYGLNWEAYLDNLHLAPAWYIHGALDALLPVETAREFHKIAEAKKLNVTYLEFAHNGHEGAPEDELLKSYEWAIDKVRAPYPKKFQWTADHLDYARFSWVEVTRFNASGKLDHVKFKDNQGNIVETRPTLNVPAHFDVDVKGQSIELKTKEIEKIRIWWNPAVVDLAKEVTIKVNGKSKWKGVPAVSIKVMLDDAARTGRRDLVFYGGVEVDGQ